MKVIILNNDFRVYWKGRLTYLHHFLLSRDITLYAVELFGKGLPYRFDEHNSYDNPWLKCLFPQQASEELSSKKIKQNLFVILDAINPDIIIAPSIVFYAGALGLRWAKKNKKKFIMFDDALPWQVERNFLVQSIKSLIISQADALWFPTIEYAAEFKYFLEKKMHIFYGYNCVDNLFFKRNENYSDTKIILCVARLVPVKNIDGLLKCWQQIEKMNSGYKLFIVGDGPLYEDLKTLKNNLNLTTVEFSGAVDYSRIDTFYRAASAFILPSLSESWGLVVNEAMAAALPVLLSYKVNAHRALLNESVNGFGFNPSDLQEISRAILKFIHSDAVTKQSMSANSVKIINDMSYEKMALQLLNALDMINKQEFKKQSLLAFAIINFWYGRYNKTGWYTSSK